MHESARTKARVEALSRHLRSTDGVDEEMGEIKAQGTLAGCTAEAVQRCVDGETVLELKRTVYRFYEERPELLQLPDGATKEQHRELVRRQLHAIVGSGLPNPFELFLERPELYFAVADAAAMVDLSLLIKLGVQYTLWGSSVINLGTKKHEKKYRKGIATLEIPGCFAMTELRHGSNVAMLQTEAVFDNKTDEFIIQTPNEGAIKWWIGNAAEDGKMATVFARLKIPKKEESTVIQDLGVHAFIVPIRGTDNLPLPGIEIRDCGYKIGLNGIDNGALRFHQVRIPRGNLLDRFAQVARDGSYHTELKQPTQRFAATLGELVSGRVALACGSNGVLKGAITIAVRYGAHRQQFGPPGTMEEVAVLDYQTQQEKLMPILASSFAFTFANKHLVQLYKDMKTNKNPELVADVHSLAAGLKAHITRFTAGSLNTCRECCGGHGYATINRLGALRSDHDIFQTFEGDNTVLMQQVAADLLKQYKRKFASGGIAATWTYLQEQMTIFFAEKNPLVTHSTDEWHLRDQSFLLHALRYRTARLVHTAALRLRKESSATNSFDAWNMCLSHLISLAHAHIEAVIAEKFIKAVRECKDLSVKPALRNLCDLYCLSRIWDDIGRFSMEDYVAPSKARAIQKLVIKLCAEVRQDALLLVDSFGIPDHILRAPIALQGNVNSAPDYYDAYLRAVGFVTDSEISFTGTDYGNH